MSLTDRDRWNGKYSQREPPGITVPDEWLIESMNMITELTDGEIIGRRALDVACGLGHNAIELAQRGWDVDGVDISAEGLKQASQAATLLDQHVNWLEADLDDWSPDASAYDLAIVFRFLDRETVPRIVQEGLRHGGWLIYETFSAGQLERPDSHIRNPTFTLAPGELTQLFPDFDVIVQREDVLDDRTVERLLARRQ